MSLYLEEEGEITLPFETKEVADLVVEAALEYEGCPYEAEINLLLTTDDEIHRMNEEFRQIDRATDVLSFPMLEYETPGDFSFVEEEAEAFNPESGELMLGDIVISKGEPGLRLEIPAADKLPRKGEYVASLSGTEVMPYILTDIQLERGGALLPVRGQIPIFIPPSSCRFISHPCQKNGDWNVSYLFYSHKRYGSNGL